MSARVSQASTGNPARISEMRDGATHVAYADDSDRTVALVHHVVRLSSAGSRDALGVHADRSKRCRQFDTAYRAPRSRRAEGATEPGSVCRGAPQQVRQQLRRRFGQWHLDVAHLGRGSRVS